LGRANREGGRIAIFSPNLLLTIAIESRGEGSDEIHLHAGGQGVWAARAACELGANPAICGLIGGETGAVLGPLLERLLGRRRLVRTETAGGCHIFDRRGGERELVSRMAAEPPSRHQRDDLFSLTCAEALESEVLVICNPDRPDAWPLDVYASLASDVGDNGTPVLVDLSSPRLDSALEGSPHLVKINDWELAEFVSGPVETPAELLAGARALRDAGAAIVVVTRGEKPALVLHEEEAWTLTAPRFDRGFREGCGDSMMGGIAAQLAGGADWRQALITGAAAGAANFLRHGVGSASGGVVADLGARVTLVRSAEG
jgi:1-phosphofructokinase